MPKQIHVGPSWTEVIIATTLSVIIGVTLGAASLVLKPVFFVKELPKEPVAGAIYFIEGSKDGTKGRQYTAKRKAFAQGESVVVNEEEINLIIASVQPPAAPAAAPKPKPKPGEATEFSFDVETKVNPLNVRINNGLMQLAVPIKVSIFGAESTVVVLAQGTFVKGDNGFVFEPSASWAGSCPLDRLPIVNSMVFKKFIGAQPVPDDIAASWAKLVGAHVEGSTLKLVMP
jgi:hypothetical protein